MGSFFQNAVLAVGLGFLVGCGRSGDETPLVVATDWPAPARDEVEALVRRGSDNPPPIAWVVLEPGERLVSVVDRRKGVDLILGGSGADYLWLGNHARLLRYDRSDPNPWRMVRRSPPQTSSAPGDPRDDPASLHFARSTLEARGWSQGFEDLVRQSAQHPYLRRTRETERTQFAPSVLECVAIVQGGRNPEQARRVLQALNADRALGSRLELIADGLLADYLGAALVDASDELRDASLALVRFGHPVLAERSMGERAPWPPASVARLLADPANEPLVETLLEQIAPDPIARAWLQESWMSPSRRIDGDLLAELASAAEGRLAGEPRFRAWLRSEWTAWHRQLYRRVARLAGGYVPS